VSVYYGLPGIGLLHRQHRWTFDVTATSTPMATATSTSIVRITAGAVTGTAAITMTLTGLTLGGARAVVAGGFQMKSLARAHQHPTLKRMLSAARHSTHGIHNVAVIMLMTVSRNS
jgi:hypothetical protein